MSNHYYFSEVWPTILFDYRYSVYRLKHWFNNSPESWSLWKINMTKEHEELFFVYSIYIIIIPVFLIVYSKYAVFFKYFDCFLSLRVDAFVLPCLFIIPFMIYFFLSFNFICTLVKRLKLNNFLLCYCVGCACCSLHNRVSFV